MPDINYKLVAGMSIVLLFLMIFWLLHRRDKDNESRVDLDELLLDDGKMSKAAVVMLGAFGLTTWMMIVLTLKGNMTEGYLGIYVAAWITPVVTALIVKKNPNGPESS